MQIITRDAFKNYPLLSRLYELHDVPKQLYIEGELPRVSLDEYGRATPRILTIVGSRRHTAYAQDVIHHLVQALSGHPVVIVSGLALGIDGYAHKEALKHRISTLSIPGSGLDRSILYPRTHRALADEILTAGGCLLSELAGNMRAAKYTFPMRNRVMAALSDAVLIIEAEEKSGTLITARQALELGRDIGAVPGNIFSATSVGTNALIREGAYAITKPRDLFDLLHLSYTEEQTHHEEHFTENERTLLEALQEPQEKDTLMLACKLSPTDFLVTLSSLEMKGVVAEAFGEVRRIV